MRGRMPNFVARRSLWLIPFGNRWSRWFWFTTITLITLILVHLNTFSHPFKLLGGDHTLYKIERVEATCLEDGNVQYYTCWKCDKLFTDAKATTEIAPEDTVIPKLEHNLVTKEAEQIGEGYGTIKHSACTECNGTFDTVTKSALPSVITPLKPLDNADCVKAGGAHQLYKSRNVECDGSMVDLYHCSVCLKTFEDSDAKKEFDFASYNRKHELTVVRAKTSTCDVRGNIEHYKCTECEKLFAEKSCKTEVSLSDVQLPYNHHMGHGVDYNDPKNKILEVNGTQYEKLHFCWTCEKMFADYDGEREVPRPMNFTLFGFTFSIWTPILAVWMLYYLIQWICVIIAIRHQYVEFYDDFVIRKSGVFRKRSRRTIFPQLTSVSASKHILNWGEVIIDVVGPWDVDLTDIARPGALRDYLLDHMVNSAAVENIGSNPYIATMSPAVRDDIFPGDRF